MGQDSEAVPKTGLVSRGLSLWRGERCLFQNLDFELAPGEILHLVGPNGVGKTSLMRVVAGLTLAEDGQVFWNGKDTRRSREVFAPDMIFAGHREGLKDELTAPENLDFWLALRGIKYAPDMLDQVGLRTAKDIPVGRMSAGQRRRVVMARVMASGAKLWLLDEPFSNLDTDGVVLLKNSLIQHVNQGGLVLITSHNALELEGVQVRRLEMAS
ncbi:MAG: cytochrome c biogenesis heme-transporting ATPase CcmA [Pseudomonadota bacterium]